MENIQLIHGEALEEMDKIIKQGLDMDNVVFVSDPPFNINYHYDSYKDKIPEDKYYEMLGNIFSNWKKVIIHYPEQMYKFAFQVGEFPCKIVSWVYNSNTPRQHREIAFFGVKPDFTKVGQPYKNPKDKRIAKRIIDGKKARLYDWWNINQVKNVSEEKTDHPAQMPLEVMERIIGILPDKYTIIDPFMGSGTTLLACHNLNRRGIGIEMDRGYYDIAVDRLNNTQ